MNAPDVFASARPTNSQPRTPHHAAVTSTTPLDRSTQHFLPVYAQFTLPVERGGYDLAPGPAMMLSAIIQRRGTPTDGRRLTELERQQRGAFSRRTLGAGDLRRLFGWSYDQIQAWGDVLADFHPCPYCRLAHPLIRFERKRAAKKNYDLVRCGDVAARAIAPKPKRRKTGGRSADGTIPPPTLFEPEDDGASAAMTMPLDDDPLGLRTTAVRALARLQGFDLDPNEVAALARASDVTQGAAIDTMIAGVIARRSLFRRALTPNELAEIVAGAAGIAPIETDPLDEAEETVGISPIVATPAGTAATSGAWDADRLAELVAREPASKRPGPAMLARYLTEFRTACLERCNHDLETAQSALAGILTHPRVVGRDAYPQPASAIAMIRAGIRDGWIFEPAGDGRDGPMRTAFSKLNPGERARAEELIREAAAANLIPWDRLATVGVYSPQMIEFIARGLGVTLRVPKRPPRA